MDPAVYELPSTVPSEEEPIVVNYTDAKKAGVMTAKPIANKRPNSLDGNWGDLSGISKKKDDDLFDDHDSSGMNQREERRANRRIVPKEKQPCEIKFKSHVLQAMLIDESKYGFSVLTDRLEGLKIGKKAYLHTKMGRFLIKVVYINGVARPDGASSENDTWFRLGVKRARSFFLL